MNNELLDGFKEEALKLDNRELETKYIKKRPSFKTYVKQYFLIFIGVLILDIGFYFFLSPEGIVTGGMTGLSIVLRPWYKNISWFKASIFLYIVDFIALIIGLIFVGKDFFFKTLFGSILVPTILLIMELLIPNENYFLDTINEEATKKLMAVIIGVGLSAIGLGIAIKSNGSTGGMDVVQKILSKYFHIPLSITMYLTDLIVVFLSGFVKMDTRIFTTAFQIENVVWGSLGVFATGIIVDVICLSLNGKRVVYIITDNPLIIKDMIYKEFDRGVTLSNVKGGYTNLDKTMIICTMDKKEAYRISSLVKELDEKSFTFITKCSSVIGEYERRSIF